MCGLRPEKRFLLFALACALTIWIGCAGTAPDAPPSSTEPTAAKAVREEFDPRSIQEDLLLIQPNFPRPGTTTSRSTLAAEAEPVTEAAPFEPIEPPPTTGGVDAELPLTELPLTEAPATQPRFRIEMVTEQVYRVQIMAVSNESIALERAEELRQKLGVPVFVTAHGHLFVVRVGSFATRKEAGEMKNRVAAMHNDYREAYLINVDETRELRIPIYTEPEIAAAPRPAVVRPEPEPEPVLVPAFGWRVLLSQFLTNEDAVKGQRKIKRQYKRDDVDVTFAAPWYKVEMGHFTIDEEAKAQELTEFMKSKGYDALKVRSQVLIPKTSR